LECCEEIPLGLDPCGVSLSADARYAAFSSTSSDIIPTDTNATKDVFVRDTCIGAPAAARPPRHWLLFNLTAHNSSSGPATL
jgi:hypothetical protein